MKLTLKNMQQKFFGTTVFQPFQHQGPPSLVDLTLSILVKTFPTWGPQIRILEKCEIYINLEVAKKLTMFRHFSDFLELFLKTFVPLKFYNFSYVCILL